MASHSRAGSSPTTGPRRRSRLGTRPLDSAFFELGPSNDLGGNHHCRAQITVSPADPQVATPTVYTELLGTKLCDADWFVTHFEGYWHPPDPDDPQLWTVEFAYSEVGWFSVSELPAVAVVREAARSVG
ncbi:MAG: hypothetical protein L0H64_13345 [Pseudonocardia sp.]|nr:hypothetical protein [Pseudonocardia sp.]